MRLSGPLGLADLPRGQAAPDLRPAADVRAPISSRRWLQNRAAVARRQPDNREVSHASSDALNRSTSRRALADPKTYEDTILRIFAKTSERGSAFGERRQRRHVFQHRDRSAEAGQGDRPHVSPAASSSPSQWTCGSSKTGGKSRAAHKPTFIDHVVGSTLFRLLSHNARCHGLPGVYSYLPGVTNLGAMRTFAGFVRAHRETGRVPRALRCMSCSPISSGYGDNLPVGPDARAVARSCGRSRRSAVRTVKSVPATWDLITALVRPVVRDEDGTRSPGSTASPWGPRSSRCSGIWPSYRWTRRSRRSTESSTRGTTTTSSSPIRISHALHEADARIDSLVDELGVKRKLSKELRTALSGNGQPSADDPAYRRA